MSVFHQFRTPGSRNSYASSAQLARSSLEEKATREVETDANEVNEENRVKLIPDLVDEGIEVSLEPIHAQISALTEMRDCLIHSNSARETATASTHENYTRTNRSSAEHRKPLHCQRWHHLPPRYTRRTNTHPWF